MNFCFLNIPWEYEEKGGQCTSFSRALVNPFRYLLGGSFNPDLLEGTDWRDLWSFKKQNHPWGSGWETAESSRMRMSAGGSDGKPLNDWVHHGCMEYFELQANLQGLSRAGSFAIFTARHHCKSKCYHQEIATYCKIQSLCTLSSCKHKSQSLDPDTNGKPSPGRQRSTDPMRNYPRMSFMKNLMSSFVGISVAWRSKAGRGISILWEVPSSTHLMQKYFPGRSQASAFCFAV